jgi:TRAP-type C4-dicarboxylate transport system permease small subunit
MFFVLAMVMLIVWQVIARYWLHISAPYAEEFARLAIVWCIFLGATVAVRYEEHMRVDVLCLHFPRPVRFVTQIIIYLMMITLAVVMIVYGIKFYRATANDFATTLGYGRNIFYLPTPVCGVLILLYSIGNCVKFILQFPHQGQEAEERP